MFVACSLESSDIQDSVIFYSYSERGREKMQFINNAARDEALVMKDVICRSYRI